MTERPSVSRRAPNAETNEDLSEAKKHFEEPKLKFIEPELKKHGDATKITGGIFGSFSPGGDSFKSSLRLRQ